MESTCLLSAETFRYFSRLTFSSGAKPAKNSSKAVRNSYDLNAMSVPMKFREIGDFHEYYSGARVAPYLTIFVGGNHEASNHLFELYYGGWAAPNIYYLGAANVIRCGPLRIAGLSGIWKGYNYRKSHHERLPYNQDDIKSAYHVREFDVRKLLQIKTQVDVGISHDWPKGVEWLGDWKALFAQKSFFEADAKAGTLGSVAGKYVMDRLRPPHWFSAHLHCKFSALVRYAKIEEQSSQLNGLIEARGQSDADEIMANASAIDNAPAQQNTEEIEIDLDEFDDGANSSTPSQAPQQAAHSVPEDLRAKLPESFRRPPPVAPPVQEPFPDRIRNTMTRFLALDKCLPHRKFLQLLEIETISEQDMAAIERPFRLSYDREWLAITRVFSSELVIGDSEARVPPDKGGAQYRSLIEAEEDWVEKNVVAQGKLLVPENFEVTAPVYDISVGITTRDQPKEYTNPQTSAFCNLIQVNNPFDISEAERQQRQAKGPGPEAPRQHNGRGGRGNRGGRGWGPRNRGRR